MEIKSPATVVSLVDKLVGVKSADEYDEEAMLFDVEVELNSV